MTCLSFKQNFNHFVENFCKNRVERPTEREARIGQASVVELYKCSACLQITRFPRFNNPLHLLSTRLGRCGEWANAFCLVCRALGLDAAYVMDWTDHVWVEVWVPSLQRFAHLDPCERALDTPLLYEGGWGKKLHHVVAFSRYGVRDVSSRYSRKLAETIPRRSVLSNGRNDSQQILPEVLVRNCLTLYDEMMYTRFQAPSSTPTLVAAPCMHHDSTSVHYDTLPQGADGFRSLAAALEQSMSARFIPVNEAALLSWCGSLSPLASPSGPSVAAYRRERDRCELEGLSFLAPSQQQLAGLRGRVSGDRAWRLARGEGGD